MGPDRSMGVARVVHNAIIANDLFLLKTVLSNRSTAEVTKVLATKVNGTTPLLIACRHGCIDIVEYLVNTHNADIEQPGTVSFDGEPIEDAPPLWCAAAAGHLEIVKFLTLHGANINSTTRTHSTPLRAACFDGHLEIVEYLINRGADIEIANRHGHTCLMIACFKGHLKIARLLVDMNANVNRCSVKGNTALHDCAESGSLAILKLLLDHGATMKLDNYGMSPLLAASVCGHHFTVEHLLQLPSVSRKNRIEALELLGATFVDKKRDMVNALGYWRRALIERSQDPPIEKDVLEPIAAYNYAVEVTTLEELDELILEPDEMRMQALIVRQRILGPTHPDTSYYLRYRGANYADAGRFDRCIDLWTYALDMQQKILIPLSPMTQSSFLAFAELFSFLLMESGRLLPRGRVVPPIDSSIIFDVFLKVIAELERGQKWLIEQEDEKKRKKRDTPSESESKSEVSNSIDKLLDPAVVDASAMSGTVMTALQIASLLTLVMENTNMCPLLKRKIMVALYKLNKLQLSTIDGRTPLHYACYREGLFISRYQPCQFPSVSLVKALLKVGADPNVEDFEGNRPLHLIASSVRLQQKQLSLLLLENGAHIDSKNMMGETYESILEKGNMMSHVNPLKFKTLACLAACVIQKHKISYKNNIPSTLYEFVEQH